MWSMQQPPPDVCNKMSAGNKVGWLAPARIMNGVQSILKPLHLHDQSPHSNNDYVHRIS
jgi:hypothetical protein